jgi:predicted nucleic acid-binding protein
VIIADTNLIAYLLIPSQFTVAAEAVFEKDPVWAAPLLWRSEFRNTLWMYVRNGQKPLSDVLHVMRTAEALMFGREYEVDSAAVLALAAQAGHTPYDCEFVQLARDQQCPLVTSDKKVLALFPGTAVTMEDFVK